MAGLYPKISSSLLHTRCIRKNHFLASQPLCFPQCTMSLYSSASARFPKTIFGLSNLILLSLLLGNVFCHEESGGDDTKSTTEITAGRQVNFGPALGTSTSAGTMGTRRGTTTSGTTYRQSHRHYGNVRPYMYRERTFYKAGDNGNCETRTEPIS